MKIKLLKSIITLGVILISMSSSGQTSFSRHAIATPDGPIDVYTSDVNGDGFQDILTITYPAGQIAWWENDHQGGYVKKNIGTGLAGGRSVRAGDIDGDGDTDILAAGVDANRIEWYENDGSQSFTKRVLTSNFIGAHTLEIVDLDKDQDMDILCSGWDNTSNKSEQAWWENNGSQSFTKHLISNTLDQAPFIASADFDLDGDLDLVATDETPGEVYWYRNNGQMVFEEIIVDAAFGSAHTLSVGDVDLDGDTDVMVNAWTGSQAWYENDGQGVFEKHSMQTLGGAMWIDLGDFDLDGDNDLISIGSGSTRIALYNNDGNQRFTKQNISGTISSGFGLSVRDMDNDHDLDIVAVGFQSDQLIWWKNKLDKQSLLDEPAWIVPGNMPGEFFVSNPYDGNIICCEDTQPLYGIASGGYKEGMLVRNDVIWVTSGPMLNKYDLETGVLLSSIRTETQYLSSISSDPSGIAYINAPLDGKVFSFDPETEDINLLSSEFDYPYAVRFDQLNNELIVLDGEVTVTIKTLNPDSGEVQVKNVTDILSGGDITPDGSGNYYVSSLNENRIYTLISDLSAEPQVYAEGLQGPWGLWYDNQTLELLVVMNTGNSLERIPATATKVLNISSEPGPSIHAYWENGGGLTIRFENCDIGYSQVFLMSMSGQVIKQGNYKAGPDRMINVSWRDFQCSRNGLISGIYIVGISGAGKIATTKVAIL